MEPSGNFDYAAFTEAANRDIERLVGRLGEVTVQGKMVRFAGLIAQWRSLQGKLGGTLQIDQPLWLVGAFFIALVQAHRGEHGRTEPEQNAAMARLTRTMMRMLGCDAIAAQSNAQSLVGQTMVFMSGLAESNGNAAAFDTAAAVLVRSNPVSTRMVIESDAMQVTGAAIPVAALPEAALPEVEPEIDPEVFVTGTLTVLAALRPDQIDPGEEEG